MARPSTFSHKKEKPLDINVFGLAGKLSVPIILMLGLSVGVPPL